MTSFDDREKAFEDKFKHDQELQFRVTNRRNKLLGLWAAAQLGKAGADAEAYAKDVVMSDFQAPGDDDVIQKIVADFKAAGVDQSEHRIRRHMEELQLTAKEQVMRE
jgi:hypothetical protein